MPTPFPLADNLLLEDPDAPHAGRPDPIHVNIEMGPLAPCPSGIALAEDEMSDQAVADDGAVACPATMDLTEAFRHFDTDGSGYLDSTCNVLLV
jgi:hypothetical protein